MNAFDAIPAEAEVFAVEIGAGGRMVLNGDIIHDHDNGCWKFISIVRAARVSDCQVIAKQAVGDAAYVTTTPTAFNLRIVWEVEPKS